MHNIFQNKSILLIPDSGISTQSYIELMHVLGFKTIFQVKDAEEGYNSFKAYNQDIVIGDMIDGEHDIIKFCQLVRTHVSSPNKSLPVLCVAAPDKLHLVQRAKEVRMTDLLRIPFSATHISSKLRYLFSLSKDKLDHIYETYQTVSFSESKEAEWPKKREALSLTQILLDFYLKHHEIVFAKLKLAQIATTECIEQARKTYEKIKDKDNTNIYEFRDFEQMWDEIVNLFVRGGLTEEDMNEIERLIKVIPKDIRQHYDSLTQQDKSFLALVESLNETAYKNAKNKVTLLQAQPNPLNGMNADDYSIHDKSGPPKALLFKPKPRHNN